MRAELTKKELFDIHRPTIRVCVFKTSLDKISKGEFKQITDKSVSFQLEEDIELKTTKIPDEPGKRLLKIRVQPKAARLILHELITRLTKGTYSTSSDDLAVDDMQVMDTQRDEGKTALI